MPSPGVAWPGDGRSVGLILLSRCEVASVAAMKGFQTANGTEMADVINRQAKERSKVAFK